jgi:hypothetical protein
MAPARSMKMPSDARRRWARVRRASVDLRTQAHGIEPLPRGRLVSRLGEVGALLHKNFERIQGSAASSLAQEEPLS